MFAPGPPCLDFRLYWLLSSKEEVKVVLLFYPNPLSPWRPGDLPPLSSMKRLPLVFGESVRPRYFSPLGERGGV